MSRLFQAAKRFAYQIRAEYLSLSNNCIFIPIMGYAKERAKLEKLLKKLDVIHTFDEKNMATLQDVHENYSHTVRILKNKAPELFLSLYESELQAVKDARKVVRESVEEEPRQANFMIYKEAIIKALDNTIKVTNETV